MPLGAMLLLNQAGKANGEVPGGLRRRRHFHRFRIGRSAIGIMDRLTAFGLLAVTAMLVTYALEKRSPWLILAFAGACLLGSVYGFLQGAWPFGIIEAIWACVAFRRYCYTAR